MSVSIRRSLRSVLGKAYRLALGPPALSVMDLMIRHNLDRWTMYARTVDFLNFEAIEGDILEFGVFGGVSLALLVQAHSFDPKGMTRRIAGYDSFKGLSQSEETHARWKEGDCSRVHAWHPILKPGDPVTKEVTLEVVDRWLDDADEETLHNPEVVNARRP